jgi:hypothetical protein
MPLADELFDLRCEDALALFPACDPIVPYLRDRSRGLTVEEVLDELQSEADRDERRAGQLLAVRLYLQCMLRERQEAWEGVARGVNNYLSLIDDVRHSRSFGLPVTLVTFNYDTMLDRALSLATGYVFQSISDYVSGPELRLFKVHGSLNWIRLTGFPARDANAWEIANQLIANGHKIPLSDDYAITTDAVPTIHSAHALAIPALAVPFRTKAAFECPPAHIQLLDSLFGQTS